MHLVFNMLNISGTSKSVDITFDLSYSNHPSYIKHTFYTYLLNNLHHYILKSQPKLVTINIKCRLNQVIDKSCPNVLVCMIIQEKSNRCLVKCNNIHLDSNL